MEPLGFVILQKSFVVEPFGENEYLVEIFGLVVKPILILPFEEDVNTSCCYD